MLSTPEYEYCSLLGSRNLNSSQPSLHPIGGRRTDSSSGGKTGIVVFLALMLVTHWRPPVTVQGERISHSFSWCWSRVFFRDPTKKEESLLSKSLQWGAQSEDVSVPFSGCTLARIPKHLPGINWQMMMMKMMKFMAAARFRLGTSWFGAHWHQLSLCRVGAHEQKPLPPKADRAENGVNWVLLTQASNNSMPLAPTFLPKGDT